jgi:cell division protein FtsL
MQGFLGFLLVLVLVASVAMVYLNVSARAVTMGHEIQAMTEKIQNLDQVNEDLETQLATLRSSSTMEERARELGFEPADAGHITYMEVPGYTGRQPIMLAQPPGPLQVEVVTLAPQFTESLGDWFVNTFLKPAGFFEGGIR